MVPFRDVCRGPRSHRPAGVQEREAVGVRGVATQAEVDLDRGIRQKAPDLQHRAAKIEAAERDAEEMRTPPRHAHRSAVGAQAAHAICRRPVLKNP